ncbi:hypothetical protein DJ568_08755 [Mucilaginibacter hurinus]|uniref:Uncharacterized protein n=1 Tax=Mucilaginibacter hurinus TaxID=2201324 RepID=A0A367GP56_9SPHI|nr:hypothetical protein [Mucilaginibacter hurinus]RCH55264.1 hypothetical protein DJ568_08755 [Mucilaginibacter hurinus]
MKALKKVLLCALLIALALPSVANAKVSLIKMSDLYDASKWKPKKIQMVNYYTVRISVHQDVLVPGSSYRYYSYINITEDFGSTPLTIPVSFSAGYTIQVTANSTDDVVWTIPANSNVSNVETTYSDHIVSLPNDLLNGWFSAYSYNGVSVTIDPSIRYY